MLATLYYVHDPMCSWCWAFRPTYDVIISTLPDEIHMQHVLGGLAPDTDEPMPEDTCQYVQNHWQTIQQQVPNTRFNFNFWLECNPRRSTYPACRAVIAARNQGEQYDDKMILAIQHGYYLNARNPSDRETLIEFAGEIGLNKDKFTLDLNSHETDIKLMIEIQFAQQLGVNGFPSMVLKINERLNPVPITYNNPDTILNFIMNCHQNTL